jgi:DNA-binding response OmpR family regulator
LACGNFQVCGASDGVGGLYKLGICQPHLVILEIEDWSALERFRRLSSVPIIALTPDDGRSGVESLDRGADLFVTLLPSCAELVARVRALLRRHERTAVGIGPEY